MIQYLQLLLNTRRDDERGASAVEYGLLVALIAIIITVGVGLFGGALNNFFTDLSNTIAGW
ncbi:Flp family type IVb pilin [Nocardioides silvaticus]|uniref:Flp family type IVb pilin n=1 Tax=Nocardioides silvaticus TaxID=2201891 RepID=A0A316TMY7_9ACTN|nr:Flp family type IVb pilin [Nocardioides silvaticus]PWN03534.1 Flp family type IVb pilin [Nocardioides silvaticus]